MTDEQKQEVIDSVMALLPTAEEPRIRVMLSLVLLEIESYNVCGNEIDWEKLSDVITEVLYQSLKMEQDESVSSVKRGDTTISFTSKSSQVQNLLSGYKDLLKKVIGCGKVIFW